MKLGNIMDSLLNQYQGVIEELVKNGHTILQVFNADGTCLFFDVLDFQEAFTSAAGNTEFNAVRGFNITNFMRTQGGNPNIIAVRAKFAEYLMTKGTEPIRCEFSRDIRWMKWASASR